MQQPMQHACGGPFGAQPVPAADPFARPAHMAGHMMGGHSQPQAQPQANPFAAGGAGAALPPQPNPFAAAGTQGGSGGFGQQSSPLF
jgi:hypothetical protein